MSVLYSEFLADEAATVDAGWRLGSVLAQDLEEGAVLFLDGVLGAGKTTFCRGMLAAFGHSGPVKSPTYTLVEPYHFPKAKVYHFDLYRLGNPEELEFMGIRDYFQPGSLCILEWPGRGAGFLPAADLLVSVTVEGQGRRLTVDAPTDNGKRYLSAMPDKKPGKER